MLAWSDGKARNIRRSEEERSLNLNPQRDRVGCRGLRPGTLPHHRTCGFPHTAVGPLGVLPSRSRGRVASEHSDGLGAFRVRPVVSQSRVVTVVVTPRCFVLSLAIPSSASVGSVRSFGPSLETPFCSCVPLTLLWPLLTSRSLSTPGSPRVSACSFRSRLWALQHAVSDSWASLVLACSPPTSCLTAHLCSFGRTFASRPFAPAPCGDDLAVRLRLASQAPGGNLSSRETRHLPGTRARTFLSAERGAPPDDRALGGAEAAQRGQGERRR